MKFTNRQYEALETLGVLTAESLDVQDVYSRLANVVADIVPHDGMVFSLLESDLHAIRIVTDDLSTSRKSGKAHNLNGTLMERVLSTKHWQSFVCSESSQLEGMYSGLLPSFDMGYRSWLVVPVLD